MRLDARHELSVAFTILAMSAASSLAGPRLISFQDKFDTNVPVGLPAFVGVQLLKVPEAQASEVVSFNHKAALGTKLCLAMTSQDGRYNASGEIDMADASEGVQSISLPIVGDRKQFVTSLLEREFAVDLSYGQNCSDDRDKAAHVTIWFGSNRPEQVTTLLFQALDDDAYLVTDPAQPSKVLKCAQVSPQTIKSAAAFDTACELKVSEPDAAQQIEINIIDPFGSPEKSIQIKVVE
ncbi:hypothetical protein NE852_00130 (plasmid) [Rhizobium sp. Pop5]|uniref:hypothetical protein n=1 Tax=Rhizobium sp. Pop5 TaxID=1223565 RepID=UPI000283BBBC|nr:hypothetical protein [Rhizobium sp. Pop5]EJZ17859.1 hypothetical protein RCCGEPOP_28594 [Rhizobium sp. Pop5]UVD54877.1 hypothetical protein NE852_00130 [Rhizobium sp. Pop5]